MVRVNVGRLLLRSHCLVTRNTSGVEWGKMMKKAREIYAAVLFLFLPLAACNAADDGGVPEQPLSADPVVIESATGEHSFTVELALTPEARARGLMYRTELAPDKGMLFVFDDSAPRSFWMRNTYIPLDIIFIRLDGKILNIVREARPRTETSRQSIGSAIAVFEIAGGRAQELGIEAGDYIRHPLIDGWQPR